MITSATNPLLKDVRRLQKGKRDGRFVAEGEDLVAAAAAAGWEPEVLLRAGEDIERELLDGVSALGSGTRVLAIYLERWAAAPAGPVAVYLHGVQDPGNVGTVLRGALAFGAGSVVIGPGTADPFGAKAVRASMGAVFEVPVVKAALADCPGPRVALVARRGQTLAQAAATADGAGTVVVGAERAGLPADVIAGCELTANIPIASESLNAAMAATLGLYELTTRVARG